MRKPNFFIIGAPKCGTTSLAGWLEVHPSIFVSPIKEPEYFHSNGIRTVDKIDDYERLFSDASDSDVAVGEASTIYLSAPEAVPNILEYDPSAKFIICIRNPVEMAPSLHAQKVWEGEENEPDFQRAWELQDERARGRFIPKTVQSDPQRIQYASLCKLGQQVERVLSVVRRDRVHVVRLDDMKSDPKGAYLNVLEFLGIRDDGRNEFPVLNQRRGTRSVALSMGLRALRIIKRRLKLELSTGLLRGMHDWNTVESTSTPGLGMNARLQEYFRDDIIKLGKVLGTDYSEWLT